ncbi:hypothetical protein PQX77_014841 [Marasmius sp. AFHP31]|nr:hypothetical protein PQX77_014841 [Marasmius sp. AFHP31]
MAPKPEIFFIIQIFEPHKLIQVNIFASISFVSSHRAVEQMSMKSRDVRHPTALNTVIHIHPSPSKQLIPHAKKRLSLNSSLLMLYAVLKDSQIFAVVLDPDGPAVDWLGLEAGFLSRKSDFVVLDRLSLVPKIHDYSSALIVHTCDIDYNDSDDVVYVANTP